jgi:hypothetical protein
MDEEVCFPLLVQGRPVDDSGYAMEIRLGSEITRDNMGFYEVQWYNPIMEGGRVYGFVILPRNGQSPVYSPSFRFP